ncbi:MAG: fructose-1,6-bisphosphatase [Candidatus Methanoperedens sp.]|nr:fructose-1,6-bisphosphatase [Candidatus Methanoperedens sp.]MCE8424814.1 fructose-1,6-bisphosphatase [Candidatus Methanoperedens sp.]MCE8429496.1 fructose-1,6-bisphosphatase [Candidatus Methanoperedens sp.]
MQCNVDRKLLGLILFFSEHGKTIKSGFLKARNKAGTKNIYGEEQMALDKWADEVLINGLKKTRSVRYIATEEQSDIIEINDPENEYGVVIDPLDGSSLIDVNLAVGTIVGIYPGHVLEPGEKMIAAMYILYGPLTTLTLTTGNGVHDFVMDENGVFFLTAKDIKIPDGRIYAPGALRKDYLPAHARFIESLENEGYKLRFSGSFVADMHQILHKGGIFTYPGSKGKEKGKLRLLFEANPMGKIITDAGGGISNGKIDILSIKPDAIDNITPIYAGGKKEIELIEKIMRKN